MTDSAKIAFQDYEKQIRRLFLTRSSVLLTLTSCRLEQRMESVREIRRRIMKVVVYCLRASKHWCIHSGFDLSGHQCEDTGAVQLEKILVVQ